MENTNVYWLVSQVGKDDIRALAMPLLMVEDTLEPVVLTFDVFMCSVETLSNASHSRKHGIVDQPLHSLPLPSFHQGKNTHDLLMWPNVDNYYSDTLNEYECDIEFGLPCAIVRDVMHHHL
jgi:hypothetical protein